jgi:Uma2 family endonuclease
MMTSRPFAPPRLLTVAEYLEFGEIELGYSELVEGRLLMSPSPSADHNFAALEMAYQIRPYLPDGVEVLLDTDVDLQLAPAAAPVLIVVEFLSPGSVRTDHVHKRGEYADAGIGHYWILDITEPVSLLARHLAGEFGYADSGAVTATFTAVAPFPVELNLDALV